MAIDKDLNPIERYVLSSTPLNELNFEVHIVDQCNLNCAGCDHFAPFAKPWFYDVRKYESDIKKIASLFSEDLSKVTYLRLQGGEPLLHPHIVDIMRITRENLPNTVILLNTNATLFERQDDLFWWALKYYNVILNITVYPNVDYSIVFEKQKQYSFEMSDTAMGKRDVMRKDVLDLSGSQDTRTSFLRCFFVNKCIPLRDGKFYICPTAATIRHLVNKCNLNIGEEDYGAIELHSIKSKEELFEKLVHEIPLCRFCKDTIWDIPWSESSRTISDYI